MPLVDGVVAGLRGGFVLGFADALVEPRLVAKLARCGSPAPLRALQAWGGRAPGGGEAESLKAEGGDEYLAPSLKRERLQVAG